MRHSPVFQRIRARSIALTSLAAAALGACPREGPAIRALPQTISFAAAPIPAAEQATATISATASSGLPVRYSSATPALCSVDAGSGRVTASASGACAIAADQAGDDHYAPAPQVTQDVTFALADSLAFSPAPAMSQYDLATVSAADRLGTSVSYSSSTPSVCSVDSATGLVVALAPGGCTIVAVAGPLQATQTLTVSAPPSPSAPGAPSAVRATAGGSSREVSIRIGAIASGGSPVTGYSVTSSPPGAEATGVGSPVIVPCPSSCAGYRFSVAAANALGSGPPSAPLDIVTDYDVIATFFEPDTQPNDSIFVGSFRLDATTGEVSGLRGKLSESMTGGATPYPKDRMIWLSLEHQLSSVSATLDGVDGLLVTTFLHDTTDTLSGNPTFGGTDAWSPGSGMGLFYGYPGSNPGNAYARVFVNTADPLAPLTQAQIDKLAYADCAPGGMMGATCMTGTSVAGYGTLGTMSGYPVSQVTTKRP
jgi:hypothetical protein